MKIDKYLLAMVIGTVAVPMSKAADNDPWPTPVEDAVTLTADQRVYLPVLDNDIGEDLVLFDGDEETRFAIGIKQSF